jgi:hypothetical protein
MGSKNDMLTESFQTSKFGKQPVSACELPPPLYDLLVFDCVMKMQVQGTCSLLKLLIGLEE